MGTGVQVGLAITASRYVVEATGPATLAMLRYAIGALCLLPFLLAARRVRFAGRDFLPVAALGIAQFGILIALLNYALQHIPSGRAALLFATFPLFTMLVGAALGRERIERGTLLGVLLTILGVGLALGEKLEGGAPFGIGGWSGELAVLGAALTGAICSVLYRPYLQRYPTLQVSVLAMTASVAFLALLALPEGGFARIPTIALSGWAAIAFIGMSSGIGYVLWLWALNHTTATRVTVFLSLSPLTAALAGAVLLGEALTPGLVAGIATVGAGLWLAQRRRAPVTPG
jgi:drug/metabolite transporter (DMT)-like permease